MAAISIVGSHNNWRKTHLPILPNPLIPILIGESDPPFLIELFFKELIGDDIYIYFLDFLDFYQPLRKTKKKSIP